MLRHVALGASVPAAMKEKANNRLLVDRWRVPLIVLLICITMED